MATDGSGETITVDAIGSEIRAGHMVDPGATIQGLPTLYSRGRLMTSGSTIGTVKFVGGDVREYLLGDRL